MIKNFEKVELPKVELGNLGLHNCCSYYVAKDPNEYPMARFGRKTSEHGFSFHMFTDYPENCPDGSTIMEQYDTPLERLLDYAEEIRHEHKDLSDSKIDKPAPFIGMKRSARWDDERRRRGLIK